MRLLSLGAVTPLGESLDKHVAQDEAQLKTRFDFQEYTLLGKKRKVAVHRAIEPTRSLPVPDAVQRRMGLSTKLVLTSIEEARERVAVDFSNKKVGLIVGTTQGPSSTNIDYFRKLVSFNYRGASPNLFAQSVHNNIASSVALTYGWKGPTITLVQESNLLKSVLSIANLWVQEKRVDYLWIILGNETSLHVPYIQLYEHVRENPEAEEFVPPFHDVSYEAFSSFLITANTQEGVTDFSFSNVFSVLEAIEARHDRKLRRPELLGSSLAAHYYRKFFE